MNGTKSPKVPMKKTRTSPTSTFHGVRRRTWGRYVSEIRLPGGKTRVWLGSFMSAEMAARAYDCAAFFLKGNAAILNFPDLVDLLPRPESDSVRDIQVAAAKAAAVVISSSSDKNGDENGPKLDLPMIEIENDEASQELLKYAQGPIFSPLRMDSVEFDLDLILQSCDDEYFFNSPFIA